VSFIIFQRNSSGTEFHVSSLEVEDTVTAAATAFILERISTAERLLFDSYVGQEKQLFLQLLTKRYTQEPANASPARGSRRLQTPTSRNQSSRHSGHRTSQKQQQQKHHQTPPVHRSTISGTGRTSGQHQQPSRGSLRNVDGRNHTENHSRTSSNSSDGSVVNSQLPASAFESPTTAISDGGVGLITGSETLKSLNS
jgi:hypothetical protein